MSTKCSYCGETVEDEEVCKTMACKGRENTTHSEPPNDFPYRQPEE
jgi:hypothetical protein